MMTELLVKLVWAVVITALVFYVGGYYVVNRALIKVVVKIDKIIKAVKEDVNLVKKEIENKNLKKEVIQDHINKLNEEKEMIKDQLKMFDIDRMLLSSAISLLINFFGSRRLNKKKLIDFTLDTIENAQDEINSINEVLYLSRGIS